MRLDDFHYELPPELIAQAPAARRGDSRLLHLDGRTGALADLAFSGLPMLVDAADLVILNDTRVVKARIAATKPTGGRVEILVERVLDAHHALALVGASKPVREGAVLAVAAGVQVRVLAREDGFHRLRFEADADVWTVMERHGAVPLPPYIGHAPGAGDESRYQTVYAEVPGAVAAPTAGLHFDAEMLAALQARGTRVARVTLHVGAGTFQPVRVDDPTRHVMHAERYRVPPETVAAVRDARARGGRVLAVGTTTLRALETAALHGELRAGEGETRLFVYPGFRFRAVDRLLTNFHLPRSTLLMLVSAFAGAGNIRRAYRHAIDRRYRFFSYGDAMLIERAAAPEEAS